MTVLVIFILNILYATGVITVSWPIIVLTSLLLFGSVTFAIGFFTGNEDLYLTQMQTLQLNIEEGTEFLNCTFKTYENFKVVRVALAMLNLMWLCMNVYIAGFTILSIILTVGLIGAAILAEAYYAEARGDYVKDFRK